MQTPELIKRQPSNNKHLIANQRKPDDTAQVLPSVELYLGTFIQIDWQVFKRRVHMKYPRLLVVFSLLSSLVGCGKPVPQEKSAYVGEWQEKTMYLLITQDGAVKYKRLKDGGTTSINGSLQGFSGDNFDVGVGPVKTTFVVSKPPYQDGNTWKMTVDGLELTKTD